MTANKNKYLKSYSKTKVLVTGSTGFKGAWLSNWLVLVGAKVIGVGLKPEKESILFKKLNLNKRIKQYFLDIKDFSKISSVIKKEKPDIIFHLAAQSIVSTSFRDPLKTFNTNLIGSANILESVRIFGIPNLVYITSDKCYLNLDKNKSFSENDPLGGLDNYSSSKAGAEHIFSSYFHSYFKKSFLNIASARAGNVIGGRDFKLDRIVPDIIKSIIQNKNIYLRQPKSTRPWQHVLEPLSGYLLLGHKLMEKKLKKNIKPNWNFGPKLSNCKNVKFLTELFLNQWKSKKIKIIEKKSKKNIFHESKYLSLNIRKASKELNWEPRLNFNETIRFTVNWYEKNLKKENMENFSNFQIEEYLKK